MDSLTPNAPARPFSTGTDQTRIASSELGKQEFLKILVTQLQNQDPMKPLEDSDFIAQMAQFSSLEQMQSLNNGFGQSQAFSLVGKSIQASVTGPNGLRSRITGTVSQALLRNGMPYLLVGDREVPYASLTSVFQPPAAGADTTVDSDKLIPTLEV
jgi:flagellar basal-body rod modification protein FlgD